MIKWIQDNNNLNQNEFYSGTENNNMQTINYQQQASAETLIANGNYAPQKKTPKIIIPIILVVMIIIIGVIVLNAYQNMNKTNGKINEESNTLEYQFVFDFDDMTETTATYTIIVNEKEINIKYKNDIKHPQLADGPLPEATGGYTVTEEKFINLLKSVFEKIKKKL